MLEKREFEKNEFMFRLAASVTVVSGLFSLVVFSLLAVNYLQIRAADPINDPLVTEMRTQFAEAEEEDLVFAQKIRELDLLQRKAFFTSQNILRIGGVLLLIGVSVFLVSFKNMTRWRRVTPELSDTPAAEKEFLAYATSRQYVMWGGVALLGMGMVASLMTESLLSQVVEADVALVADAPAPKPAPTWDEIQMNWPSFRGPGSNGWAKHTNAPTEWDAESGKAIKWKVTLPLHGTNSPVIWGKRLFLSGASDEALEVYCYDTESGKLLWKKSKAISADAMPSVMDETGFAAPSMAVHGDQVFVIFANGDVASYDVEGNEIWTKSLGAPENHYGHSSSLIAHGDLVYIQFDQAENAKLFAFETATGKRRWSKNREDVSWASPILADTPKGLQLVLVAANMVDAYDPDTGKHLWAVECMEGTEVGPSATYSDGIIFVANDMAYASAIGVDGPEDSMDREILWQYEELLPDISSPIGDGERFYFATSYGELVCLDATSGEELWLEEVSDAAFNSSPILVGDKLYFLDSEGNMYIVRAGAEYELLGQSPIGEATVATPAFMDGRIYIRGEKNLYCIAAVAEGGDAAPVAKAIKKKSPVALHGTNSPAVLGSLLFLSGASKEPSAEEGDTETAAKAVPTWDEMQMNWPSFRGPGSKGWAKHTNAPTEWDAESGKAIKWKTPLTLQGTNSPVIWGKRLFLSGASGESLEVYCYDTESGELLWKKAKAVSADAMPTVSRETGFAAPSMVAHGDQVFVIFANGDMLSYDFEGNEIWTKNLGVPENHYGHSSSLIASGDLVYVQYDQSERAKLSKLYAFDTATGAERWAKKREEISWASPILADTKKGLQLILDSETMVDAYDPVTGKHLWAVDCLAGEVGPSPGYANGVVFVANEYAMASAISVDGPDDSLDRDVIWDFDEYLPESASPIGDGERFYFATSYGELVCLDAKPPAEGETVEKLWVEELADNFVSSPILVGDKIYVLDTEGTMFIVRAGGEYELIGTSSIGEPTVATPAFMDGRIYIRGEENLYCIES